MQTSQEHKMTAPLSQPLIIEREFNAPLPRLFEAFTTPVAIKKWWWPKGLYADRVDLDFSEDGEYFINMKGYEKGGGGMTGEFEEIVKNKRIVMTDQFADENGRAISAKEANMPGVWPEVIYITFDFEAIDENNSRVTLTQQGIPADQQADCIKGWNQSFDKLRKYLD